MVLHGQRPSPEVDTQGVGISALTGNLPKTTSFHTALPIQCNEAMDGEPSSRPKRICSGALKYMEVSLKRKQDTAAKL